MALHPEVLAELEAESGARRMKVAEAPLQDRLNGLEAKINRLEAALAAKDTSGLVPWKALPGVLVEAFKEFMAVKFNPLKAQVDELKNRPELKYHGSWVAGRTYAENSLTTRDGSLWIAKQTTASFPGGNAEPGAWQLCCKRGRDGKDAKDATAAR